APGATRPVRAAWRRRRTAARAVPGLRAGSRRRRRRALRGQAVPPPQGLDPMASRAGQSWLARRPSEGLRAGAQLKGRLQVLGERLVLQARHLQERQLGRVEQVVDLEERAPVLPEGLGRRRLVAEELLATG